MKPNKKPSLKELESQFMFYLWENPVNAIAMIREARSRVRLAKLARHKTKPLDASHRKRILE